MYLSTLWNVTSHPLPPPSTPGSAQLQMVDGSDAAATIIRVRLPDLTCLFCRSMCPTASRSRLLCVRCVCASELTTLHLLSQGTLQLCRCSSSCSNLQIFLQKLCRSPCFVMLSSSCCSPHRFVFCYPCIYKYVAEHRCCPVTNYPANSDHLVKLYRPDS